MNNSQIESTINEIRKRSSVVTAFNEAKISNAIFKALAATSKADRVVKNQFVKDFLKLFNKNFSRTKKMRQFKHNPDTNLLEIEELPEIKNCFRIEKGNLSSPSGEDLVLKSNGNIFKPSILQLGYAMTTIGHIDEIRYPQSMGFDGYNRPKNFFIECLEAKKVTREIRQKFQLR